MSVACPFCGHVTRWLKPAVMSSCVSEATKELRRKKLAENVERIQKEGCRYCTNDKWLAEQLLLLSEHEEKLRMWAHVKGFDLKRTGGRTVKKQGKKLAEGWALEPCSTDTKGRKKISVQNDPASVSIFGTPMPLPSKASVENTGDKLHGLHNISESRGESSKGPPPRR